MNPRHAAVLALVGWYLMVPPSSDLATRLEPLYQSFQIGSFDSANACEQGRRMMIDRFVADLQKDYSDATAGQIPPHRSESSSILSVENRDGAPYANRTH